MRLKRGKSVMYGAQVRPIIVNQASAEWIIYESPVTSADEKTQILV